MYAPRASELVKRRLHLAARRLGVQDPVPALGPMLDRTFALPPEDPRYGNNALTPGSYPIEYSFSELAPNALRLDMELLPEATPLARREETTRETRRLVHRNFGQDALRWLDHWSETWRDSRIDPDAGFGAFFATAFDEHGLAEAKVYYELSPDQIGALPPNLEHAVRTAMGSLPGLRPLFTSLATGRRSGAQRVYLHHRDELRLLDLEPLLHRLGIGKHLPSILTALGVITGGRFTLPEGSLVMGLRDTPRGIEMKLDLLLPAFPDPPRQMNDLIQMQLAERPEAQRALRRWMQAMTPDDADSAGLINVVGVKVDPQTPARISLYLRPFEARPRRERPGDHRSG